MAKADAELAMASATLGFEPVGPECARFLANVRTAEFPDDPVDPAAIQLWFGDRVSWLRYEIRDRAAAIGYAVARHSDLGEATNRTARLFVGFFPARRTSRNFGTAFAYLEEQLRAADIGLAEAFIREDDTVALDAAVGRGYREDRRQRYWELNLVDEQGRLREQARQSRQRMRDQGFVLTTLALDSGPHRFRQTHAISSEAQLDVPASGTNMPEPFERSWSGSDRRLFTSTGSGSRGPEER